jgi:hypothetical protein
VRNNFIFLLFFSAGDEEYKFTVATHGDLGAGCLLPFSLSPYLKGAFICIRLAAASKTASICIPQTINGAPDF